MEKMPHDKQYGEPLVVILLRKMKKPEPPFRLFSIHYRCYNMEWLTK